MTFVIADRVQETSTTSGTGTLNLAGAVNGNRTFVSGVGTGNSTYYTIYDQVAQVWEVGIGTVLAGSPNTLSRDTVLSNSSGNTSPINLAGNTVNVWCDYPAERAVVQDLNKNGYAPQLMATNGIFLNAQTVSANTSVPSGYNGQSIGPVSVASGVTVTVADNSVWVVI